MRFVLKAVFWFGLVLLFLPEDALHKTQTTEPDVVDNGAVTSSVTANDVVARVARLCSEKPAICERAADALSTIELDTEQGARLALDLLLRSASDESRPSKD